MPTTSAVKRAPDEPNSGIIEEKAGTDGPDGVTFILCWPLHKRR